MAEGNEIKLGERRQRLWNRAFWASLGMFELVGWLLAHQS